MRAIGSLPKIVMSPLNRLYLSVGSSKECPICGWTGHDFLKKRYPNKPQPSFICPKCKSSQRHRFARLALQSRLRPESETILHFAPEPCIEPWLRSMSGEYLSVDLVSPKAMAHMDITDLQIPDDTYTFVWCSHVLEHIPDDVKAMSEIYRVLQPGGFAVVMVPIYGPSTYENPEAVTPKQRLEHFRQEDHVRVYGSDIAERLANVGFKIEVITISDIDADLVSRHELDYPSTQEIFICSK
jgi:predicted SAM-dependent methyltransferase